MSDMPNDDEIEEAVNGLRCDVAALRSTNRAKWAAELERAAHIISRLRLAATQAQDKPSGLSLSVEAQAACLWLKQRAGHEEEAGRRAADLIARLQKRVDDLGALADQTADALDKSRIAATQARGAALEEAAKVADRHALALVPSTEFSRLVQKIASAIRALQPQPKEKD